MHVEHLHSTSIDTPLKTNYWHITERTGEIIPAFPDTFLTDYFNRTNVEGLGLSVAYLGNLGLPMESRIFAEREDRSEFLFTDPFYAYMRSPAKFKFMNTKIPYSNVSYQTAGSRAIKEERLQGLLAVNFGKKLNFGFDVDYLYARGYYNSQSAKHMDWVFFSNYLSGRHQAHLFINPTDYTNAENGGIENDNWISHPDYMDRSVSRTQEIPTLLSNTWNHLKGKQFYLNYRYNLGFEKDSVFVPVSSLIFTIDYKDKSKKFYTTDSAVVASYYEEQIKLLKNKPGGMNDSTSYQSTKFTAALSMREGFSEWAKFDLTAFITQQFNSFTLMDTTSINTEENTKSTYIGGELAKQKGKYLRYSAQGSFGVLGYNLGDFQLSGNIETRLPFWGDTASVTAKAYFKNLEPAYYEQHYRSNYFWWDNQFNKTRKYYIGGTIDIPHTNTQLEAGVENLTNYIYFDTLGYPKQHKDNIQILTARLMQNFQLRALHWDNQLVYQQSSDEHILPLPDFAAYSSLYVQFKITKVLTVQMGANVHYWTSYYTPAYEPATQQFKLQAQTKVGNYPLISGFLNCHLKQARFFIEYYNAGASFISPPEYFSIQHYPVNPTILKLGLSVDLFN
ncbi:hypothetical protein AGMMS50262_09820 [Bacteroidia bacterium]|nr:hypothetical protein AGMMS50262_09820 [Bacteroidia bacterium]